MQKKTFLRLLALFTFKTGLTIASGNATAADPAPQEGCSGPCIEYSGSYELNGAWLHLEDSTIDDSYFLLMESENGFAIRLGNGFSVIGTIVTEPVIEPEPGRNQIFSDSGTYMEVLQAQYDFGAFSIWGGKINPAFGRAWDVTPGLHGTDLAENYELTERLGGGGAFNFEAVGMANRLEFNAFTVDRTLLSESLFTNRGRTTLDDGGAGNTKGISSFAAALGGCVGAEVDGCYDESSFGYQLAARYQKGGRGSDGNELGFSGSLNKALSLGEDATLRLFAEAAWFRNFDGGADDALVLTGSGALELGQFTYSAAYSQLRALVVGGPDVAEHLIDATAMYDLGEHASIAGEKWSIGAGYTFDESEGEESHLIGFRLSTEFEGSIPLGRSNF